MERFPDNFSLGHERKVTPCEITNEHGSNPVVTAEDAAGDGLGGAAVGSLEGPLGAVAGAAVGVVVAGIAGKGIGETIHPSVEAAYLRQNPVQQPYPSAHAYENDANAYRIGYDEHGKDGPSKQKFEDAEAELKRDYEASKATFAWPAT